MLYKTLISTYGASLANKTNELDDPVWHLAWSTSFQGFREYALDALQQAKVYLLDHNAAEYADTFHDVVQFSDEFADATATTILGELSLPAKVTWVEFDYRAIVDSRFERKSYWTKGLDGRLDDGVHGFLFDDRNADHLAITLFGNPVEGKYIDPLGSLKVERNTEGRLIFEDMTYYPFSSVLGFFSKIGYPDNVVDAMHVLHMEHTRYDLFIPHAFFAMLVSPDLGGIIALETETFSAKDLKTARKFNKSWVIGAQKSHLTIRIGPHAVAHMRERQARLNFERDAKEHRNGPIKHWVSEHERHYKSGKIVLVKRHERGSEDTRNLATRVMGPHHAQPVFNLKSKSNPE